MIGSIFQLLKLRLFLAVNEFKYFAVCKCPSVIGNTTSFHMLYACFLTHHVCFSFHGLYDGLCVTSLFSCMVWFWFYNPIRWPQVFVSRGLSAIVEPYASDLAGLLLTLCAL